MAASPPLAAYRRKWHSVLLGKESTMAAMTTEEKQELLASADEDVPVGAGLEPARKRVLVIIPDGTRTDSALLSPALCAYAGEMLYRARENLFDRVNLQEEVDHGRARANGCPCASLESSAVSSGVAGP